MSAGEVLVSIVIPVYNRAHLVRETIASALDVRPDLPVEVIPVDDASTDDSWKVLSEYGDPRVRPIHLEQNGRQCRARNHGIAAARGRYLKFLDSDDLLYGQHLAAEVEAIEREGADLAVSGWAEERDGRQWTIAAPVFREIPDDLLAGKAVTASAGLYRRREGLAWDPSLRKLDDWDFFVEAALAAKRIVTVSGEAFLYRHHPGERVTAVASMLPGAREHMVILRKIEDRLRADGRMTRARELRLAQYYYKELRVLSLLDPEGFDAAWKHIKELDPRFQPRDEEPQPAIRAAARVLGVPLTLRLYRLLKRLPWNARAPVAER